MAPTNFWEDSLKPRLRKGNGLGRLKGGLPKRGGFNLEDWDLVVRPLRQIGQFFPGFHSFKEGEVFLNYFLRKFPFLNF